MAVGRFLSSHPLRRGEQRDLARIVGVSTRTLRTWRDREGKSRSPGRPGHGAAARARARDQTLRVFGELPAGHDGWRSVCALLARERIDVPVRLVQESLAAIKQESRAKERERIERNRVHVEVLAKDAIWGVDQTFLGRDEQGAVESLLVRDALVARTLGLSIGAPAHGEDVVRLLERVALERGGWPFVIQADNGSENKNGLVRARAQRERVAILWNEPRTPQHNARTERSIGDLKCASGLAKSSTRRADPSQRQVSLAESGVPANGERLCARLMRAWAALDRDTPRAALDALTPAELDSIAPRADDRACRARFYAEVCHALDRIALDPSSARDRRKREREAIWCALERHGLVRRTRGGCPVPALKAEGVS
jgi:hypothetical protein